MIKRSITRMLVFTASIFMLASCASGAQEEKEDFGEKIEYSEFKAAQEAIPKNAWAFESIMVEPADKIDAEFVYSFRYREGSNANHYRTKQLIIYGFPTSPSISENPSYISNLAPYAHAHFMASKNMAFWRAKMPDDPSDLGIDLYGQDAGECTHEFYKDEECYTVVAKSEYYKNVYRMEKKCFAFTRASLSSDFSVVDKGMGYHRFNYTLTKLNSD